MIIIHYSTYKMDSNVIPFNTELGIAVAGSADSGKSTFIGVITSGKLDDGDGSARLTIARHQHEINSKKTSSISTKTFLTQNNRPVTLIDLCGQEKYFRTTAYGISSHYPDYSFLIVGSNKGILPMTKQHATILMSNNIPIIIVLTRYDITPEAIYNESRKMVENYCKNFIKVPADFINSPYNKSCETDIYKIQKIDEIKSYMRSDNSKQLKIPVITISNKNGYYLDFIQTLLCELKVRNMWRNFDEDETKKPDERCNNRIIKSFINNMDPILFEKPKNNTDHVFFVDGIYNKNGIGLILAGMNRGGIINVGDTMYLGPFNKEFKEIKVKSMQNYLQQKIMSAGDHSRITIAIGTNDKEINRKTLRGGMVLLKNKDMIKNYLTYHITAAITIFHHSATLRDGYSPMLQIGNVRQTGRMILEPLKNDSKDYIKSKDFAYVTFKFKQRPEYIEPYQVFVFRSGGVHGVGIVLNSIPINNDIDARPDPHKLKNKVRKFLK